MKTEDLKRYGYELPRNGVANDLRAENERLRGLLSELVEKTGVKIYPYYDYYFCDTCHGSSLSRDEFVHAPDCAWWNAVQALGRVA